MPPRRLLGQGVAGLTIDYAPGPILIDTYSVVGAVQLQETMRLSMRLSMKLSERYPLSWLGGTPTSPDVTGLIPTQLVHSVVMRLSG
jgi:hypothetical protein